MRSNGPVVTLAFMNKAKVGREYPGSVWMYVCWNTLSKIIVVMYLFLDQLVDLEELASFLNS